MKTSSFIFFIYFILPAIGLAQSAYQPIREGNEAYKKNDYLSAEEFYRNSIRKDASLRESAFNLGNSLYRQEKYEDAARYFSQAADKSATKQLKSEAFHNLGNAHLKNQKLEEAIAAYKNALINDPQNEDSRYNLAYAMQQQQQQQEQEQQEQNEEQKEDEQDENKEEEQNQEQEQEQNKEEEQKQQEEEEQKQEQQQQKKEQQLSREDAERILEALNNKEKEIQEDLKKKKVKEVDIKIEKDW